MKQIFIFLFFTFQLNSTEWSAPSAISQSSSSIYIPQVYNLYLNRIFTAWVDADTHLVLYAIYEDSSQWSEPSIVDPEATSSTSPALCYDPSNNTMLLAWADLKSGFPMYSVYAQGCWTKPQRISITQQCCVPIGLCVTDREIVATWMNNRNQFLPIYAVYTDENWNSALEISTDLRFRAHGSVLSSYDKARKIVVTVWGNYSTSFPQYAIYTKDGWTIPEDITPFSQVTNGCSLVYDEEAAQTLAAWSDANDRQLPTYAIYNGSSWTTTHRPITGASSAESDVQLLYNSNSKTVFASWGDYLSFAPTYAIFKKSHWSPPRTITSKSGVIGSPSLCFNSLTNSSLAIWIANDTTTALTYSNDTPTAPTYFIEKISEAPPIIYHIETSSSLLGVTNLTCKQQKHHFGFVTERYNTLCWTASPSPQIIGYHIYRNKIRIASIPFDILKYQDHNQKKGASITYMVTAFDNLGHESPSTTVTIRKK